MVALSRLKICFVIDDHSGQGPQSAKVAIVECKVHLAMRPIFLWLQVGYIFGDNEIIGNLLRT